MAEVFGTIGSDQVILNNAATEATLRQLLQATLSSGKQSADTVKNLAQKTGLDPKSIETSNQGMNALGRAAATAGGAAAGLSNAADTLSGRFNNISKNIEDLTSGTAQASTLLGMFGGLKGPLGLVTQGAIRLAKFQEDQLQSYRELTKSGINFGGSLTDLRLAASGMYMSMDKFTGLMKSNGESFAKMGSNADDGARSFVKVASDMQKSKFGDQLRALGYSAEESNQHLASYITMTGGRTKKEMENTEGLAKAATEYMTELDALAQITGKSKDQQEQALKEAAANQAYQSYLLTLDEEGKKKANLAMAEASARGGKGAADALMSQLLGLPPMTKAAQEFTAVAPKMAEANNKMASAVKDTSKGINDVKRAGDALGVAASKTAEDLGATAPALIMQNGALSSTMSQIVATDNRNKQQGIKNEKDAAEQRKKIEEEQIKRNGSTAAAAAETEKNVKELGDQILTKLMPIFEKLLPYLNNFVTLMVDFSTKILNSPKALEQLTTAAGVLAAGFIAYKTLQAAAAAREFAATGGRKPGYPGAPPLMVRDVAGGPLGGALGGTGGKSGPGAQGGGSKLGNVGKSLLSGAKGFGIGSILSLGGDMLADSLGRDTQGGAAADVASKTASWAGTGAMIGSIIPGAGTAVGGVLGGLAGGAMGLYENWNTLFGESKDKAKGTPGEGMFDIAKTVFGGTGKPTAVPGIPKEIQEQIKSAPGMTEAAMAFKTEDPMEKVAKQIERLNTQTAEVIRYLKETAEQARRNVSATQELRGNLFPVP